MSAGMRRAELIEAATCLHCNRKVGETELPLFYRVTIARHGINLNAVDRHHGLELVVGSPAIAAALGPDEPMTVVLLEPVTFTICERCSMEPVIVAGLAETAGGKS